MPNALEETRDLPAVKAGLRYPGLMLKSMDPNRMAYYARPALNGILEESTNPALKQRAAESIETLQAGTAPTKGPELSFGNDLSMGPVRRADFIRAQGPQEKLDPA